MDVLVEANTVVVLGSPQVCSAVMLKGLNYTQTSEGFYFDHEFLILCFLPHCCRLPLNTHIVFFGLHRVYLGLLPEVVHCRNMFFCVRQGFTNGS